MTGCSDDSILALDLTDPFSAENGQKIAGALNELSEFFHWRAVVGGWWHDKNGNSRLPGTPHERNTPETLMLIVSEAAEAMEGYRKSKMDEHLPHRTSFEVELGDVLIRTLDLAGAFRLGVGGAVFEKAYYNSVRADHKPEARAAEGGKKF